MLLTRDNHHAYWAEVDGKPKKKAIGVTSVSGLLDKPGLKYWAVNLACDHLIDLVRREQFVTFEEIEKARLLHIKSLQESGAQGTSVHDWVEEYINSQLLGTPQPKIPEGSGIDHIVNGALAFLRWTKKHGVKFVSTERLVYSVKHGFGGQMDAEAIVDGKLRVIDWKTSKAKKPKKGKENDPCGLCTKTGCGGVYDEYRFQTAAYQSAAEEEGSVYTGNRLVIRLDKSTGEFSTHELGDYKNDVKAFRGLLVAKKRLIVLDPPAKSNLKK